MGMGWAGRRDPRQAGPQARLIRAIVSITASPPMIIPSRGLREMVTAWPRFSVSQSSLWRLVRSYLAWALVTRSARSGTSREPRP
jgi:hypothetical protein